MNITSLFYWLDFYTVFRLILSSAVFSRLKPKFTLMLLRLIKALYAGSPRQQNRLTTYHISF